MTYHIRERTLVIRPGWYLRFCNTDRNISGYSFPVDPDHHVIPSLIGNRIHDQAELLRREKNAFPRVIVTFCRIGRRWCIRTPAGYILDIPNSYSVNV